jgi:hypothetical protein
VIAQVEKQQTTKRKRKMLRFNDGVNIDTSGELRILRLKDGYYVVGQGMCIPVADREEATKVIAEMEA